jgi:aminoglycoside phosphotransferase (APT) family kinase protein
MADTHAIVEPLTKLVRSKTGDASARVTDVQALPGHAGFGYSFLLERGSAAAKPSGKLVLRVAPEGVRIAGPADVLRQARIMESLADTDVAVPEILWYGDEAEFFARPYFVDAWVDGFKLVDRPELPLEQARSLALLGVRTLAALHRVDWRQRRSAWGEPQPLTEEMKRLDHLLDRPTLDPKVVARGPELRDRLRGSLPDKARVGCVHGDFQWANILFEGGRVAALIDWEIALCGPTLLDIGWLCFFADPEGWFGRKQMLVAPLAPDEILEAYADAAQASLSTKEVGWFRAFAGYRFGVITCFNLMLHRRGKRHDPDWETTALSAPRMFERGLELLG